MKEKNQDKKLREAETQPKKRVFTKGKSNPMGTSFDALVLEKPVQKRRMKSTATAEKPRKATERKQLKQQARKTNSRVNEPISQDEQEPKKRIASPRRSNKNFETELFENKFTD